jgi:hypothetical protein
VHYVARYENDGSGSGSAGLVIGDELIRTLYNEEDFVLIKMNLLARAFTGFVAGHADRERAGREKYLGGEGKEFCWPCLCRPDYDRPYSW